jgi:hypothetical protein
VALELPPLEECPPLPERERRNLTTRLTVLAERLGTEPPGGTNDRDLEDALAALDAKLGVPMKERDPGPLAKYGPIQRQLRALLWKHGVEAYKERRLNTDELGERLEKHLFKEERK